MGAEEHLNLHYCIKILTRPFSHSSNSSSPILADWSFKNQNPPFKTFHEVQYTAGNSNVLQGSGGQQMSEAGVV